MTIYKRLKITVKTPKNKAEKSIESLRKSILMFHKESIVTQKIVRHNLFYWIVDAKKERDYEELIYKCAKSEVSIKKFYKILIKGIKLCNRGLSRFTFISKAVLGLVKRKLLNFLKSQGIQDDKDFFKDIKNMPEEEFKEFISMDGVDDVEKLISGDIIKVEELEVKEDEYESNDDLD